MAENKIMFNGAEIGIEEVTKMMATLKVLQALQKEAKKAGLLIAKVTAEKKEKSANFNLLLAQFTPVIDANRSIVLALFKEFDGQDSISFDCDKDYHVIVRSKAVVKAKQDTRKADKKVVKATDKAEEEEKEEAALKAEAEEAEEEAEEAEEEEAEGK